MSAREVLDCIKAQLAAATPGPWEPYQDTVRIGGEEFEPLSVAKRVIAPGVTEIHYVAPWVNEEADRTFIAAAPTTVARLTAAVEAVLALHRPIDSGDERIIGQICAACSDPEETSFMFYPCESVEALETALEAS